MNLNFPNDRGKKQFSNALNYVVNPEFEMHSTQRPRIENADSRKDIIIDGFKNLTYEDKELVISTIRGENAAIDEIIRAFEDFKKFDNKEDITDFLYKLMENVYDKNRKNQIFKLIYLNYPSRALEFIYENKSEDYKKELCQLCILANPERGYVYTLLNNVDIELPEKLDPGKLLNEINFIQSFTDKKVLEIVSDDYKFLKDLVDEINNRVKHQEFQTFYTLAKNIKVLDFKKFNVPKKEIKLLEWAIDITENNKDDNFMKKVYEKDLEPYATSWLVFMSLNFLQMDNTKQRLSIMILNHLLDREDLTWDQREEIAEEISLCIKEGEKNRDSLLSILGELETTAGFYNIVDLVEEEGFNLIKKRGFKTYIGQALPYTREFKWLAGLEESKKYKEPQTELDPNTLTFALMEATPKANYELLKLLKENDKDLYFQLMKNIEEIIANKLEDYEKHIKLIIALNYKSENNDIFNIVEEYEYENIGAIKTFIKICDPYLLEEYYIEQVEDAISKGESDIVHLLGEIEEPRIKNKCSSIVLKNLIENDFDKLINIWDDLTLDIDGKIEFKGKILSMINNKEIEFTEKNIAFINGTGIESIVLYKSIKDKDGKLHLLDIWHQSNEFGKIINILREETIENTRSIEDLKGICDLLENYNINDSNLDLIIQIKAYSIISMELLELDIRTEDSINKLNELGNQLIYFGLSDRFLADKFLQKKIDKGVVDYIFRIFLDGTQANEFLIYYWNNIIEEMKENQGNLDNEKLEIFLNHLTKSKNGIEWFLDILESSNIESSFFVDIIETLLILINKKNRIILQNQQEIDQMKEEILNNIGKTIGQSLGNMERTIINRTNDVDNDILIENLKKLRKELKDVDIDTVEDIKNYGKYVKFNNELHENRQFKDLDGGVVDSLGIKINGKDILLSTLLSIE